MVLPGVFKAARITALLHWADPLFSKYLIGFENSEPKILIGRLFLFVDLNLAPNFFNGSIILPKSLLDKLLSPEILISYGDLINKPSKSLAKVPEFPASIKISFL